MVARYAQRTAPAAGEPVSSRRSRSASRPRSPHALRTRPAMTESGARILLVDDDESLRRVIRRNLESRQFSVETEARARAALETWRRWRPDLIVLDLGLPDMDGQDIISEIRETSSIPIIVLSAREGEADKIRALDA